MRAVMIIGSFYPFQVLTGLYVHCLFKSYSTARWGWEYHPPLFTEEGSSK